jgi:hypothetical protein
MRSALGKSSVAGGWRPLAVFSTIVLLAALTGAVRAADQPEILPLSQVKPGMTGYAYTIFAGDQIEKFDLEVIGVLDNFLGPKQSIILVQLKGPKVEHTGVAAGMSGSPVFIEGKLAGALSLKLGIFTKEPIAGVTPIESLLEIETVGEAQAVQNPAAALPAEGVTSTDEPAAAAPESQFPVPAELAQRIGGGSGAFLTPIETPLVFSGFNAATVRRYGEQLTGYGMAATQGGTGTSQADDARVQAGDMVGAVLLQGDLSIYSACTVTARIGNQLLACGHPMFGFGAVDFALARTRVVTTLSSDLASTKIVNMGGVIGTLTQDRLTGVLGRVGPGPRMIPVELSIVTPVREKKFHFEMSAHPKLAPILIGLATFNGLVANTAYGEGTTLRLTGTMEIAGHTPVRVENMFAPSDGLIPDGAFVAANVQAAFGRVFANPYETAKIERITLRVESLPERRWASIENAWCEKSEAQPGESVTVKVLLRPYRGAPFLQDVPIRVPPQAARGSSLRILVSDSEVLNRMTRLFSFGPQGRLAGLEQVITLINRERRNNQVYVTLLQPNPTLLVEDKELPNAPLSEINVLDQRRTSGNSFLLRESTAGEWSVPMQQVIAGSYSLILQVK